MVPWFLANQKRLSIERAAIEELLRSADWLAGAEWLLCGGLCVDAVIRAHGYDYDVRLEYPSLFPEVPPTVRPRNAATRWSSHQYGSDGPLCLEWGPDNWHPYVTGAQVLESAHRLLNIENPLRGSQDDVPLIAPSRHALTLGQELRGRYGRFYISQNTLDYISRLSGSDAAAFKFSISWRTESWLAVVHEVRLTGAETPWVDQAIPNFLRGSNDEALREGVVFKTDIDPSLVEAAVGVEAIANVLRQAGQQAGLITDEVDSSPLALTSPPSGTVILDRNDKPHFFMLFKDGDSRSLAAVQAASRPARARTPENMKGLGEKSLGIVGLGSVGSKIAVSLARMGVRRFYFIDHDIFLSENIVRHALDWNSVGDHKVDGVREEVERLGVDFDVEVSRLHLTGQESTAAVSGALDKLGRCDLLIDATADPGVFNLLSAVASAYQKSMVWLQVYGGGLGGLIARSRPGRDPSPQTMRAAYLDYCDDFPAPELRTKTEYVTENGGGEVVVASDADVAIIAHHAARFVADTLSESDASVYPYSMYLIGLAKWWVFEAPFATIPLATDHLLLRDETAEQTEIEDAAADNVEFVVSLLEKVRATPRST